MPRYDFLLETYDTERLKTLSVWTQFRDEDLRFQPEPRAPHEQMVHQDTRALGYLVLIPGAI